MSDVSAEKLVEIYVKIRDKRAEIQKNYEKEDSRLKEQLELVTGKLLDICRETGVESMRTHAGTVSRSVTTRYWTSDWASMYEFIKEHDVVNLLEQRIHQGNIKSFLADNPELMPKGLNSDSKYTLRVVRARNG
jgi:sugar phosphate isomerase/epimerase